MASQSEQTPDSHTLPTAELNPLINPILAENMGRWAEVYFTSPPESREQAVMELLRELEAEKSRREASAEASADAILLRCPNCGHDNPPSNRFCGMCGATMTDEDFRPGERAARNTTSAIPENGAPEPGSERWTEEPRPYEPSAPRHELSLFQAYRDSDSDDEESGDWAYESSPSFSYRGYVGVVLAILILGLGYMAWRGMQSSQGHQVSPAPPVTAKETEPPDTQPQAPTKSDAPDRTATAKTHAEEPPTPAPAAAAKPPEPTTERREPAPAAKPPEAKAERSAPTTNEGPDESAKASPPATGRGGAEELALAQRYLSGASGQRRDTAEAAKWLWKSIAKHNGQATLLLADLYLKGDGVPKNCDQARVLLYSAARKGLQGAGERLRNLPAFGCQ